MIKPRRNLIIKLVLLAGLVWVAVLLLTNYRKEPSGFVITKKSTILHQSRAEPEFVPNQNLWWLKNRRAAPPVDNGQVPAKGEVARDEDKKVNPEEIVPPAGEENKRRVDDEAIIVPPALPELPKVDPNAPGENGRGVNIEKANLSPEDRKKFDRGWKNNAFNEFASDKISVHRSLPDFRDKECFSVPIRRHLPSCSVILCFHNEAWSVLLRSVHSILNRSPPHLIKEIILVDDFSTFDHLKQSLEDYMNKLGKVRIVRAKRREGLIRARLLGASVAQGEVLTFLDSHIECAAGWLEPLLDRVAANWSNVVTPVIDVISDSDLRFSGSHASSTQVGGFDWNLQFSWHSPPQAERDAMKTPVDPIRSPTMAGGLFTINRKYFEYLGAYDPGFDIWGGENLELSFKIWMCGGQLHVVPCSHVGHIFRKHSPYSWGTGHDVLRRNSVRLAEVWMDNYKKIYYMRINNDLGNFGDVSARRELRSRLKCKSFKWYLDTIYPERFLPSKAIAYGEIRNAGYRYCVDASTSKHTESKPVIMYPCHNQGGNQFWLLSVYGEIRRDDVCLDYPGENNVITYPCHSAKGNQHFEYREDGSIYHVSHKVCLEGHGSKLYMAVCSGIKRQKWIFKRGSPFADI